MSKPPQRDSYGFDRVLTHRLEGKTFVLLCLVSFVSVLTATPQPRVSLDLAPPDRGGLAAIDPRFAPDIDAVEAEVWGHGRTRWRHLRMLLRASADPRHADLDEASMRRLRGGDGQWRLKTLARASRLPQERRTRIQLRQNSRFVQLTGSLEALDAELAPGSGYGRRMVRRFGPGVAVRLRPPTLSDAPHAPSLHASARLWPISADGGPIWDLAADARGSFVLAKAGCPAVWAHAAVRQFAGQAGAMMQSGGFLPDDRLQMGAPDKPRRLLRTAVRGFEDESWYTTRQTQLSVGACVHPSAYVDVELFASLNASAQAAEAHAQASGDVIRHATGAAMHMHGHVAGRLVHLRYQVAMRHQGSRQPVLHMVTASL